MNLSSVNRPDRYCSAEQAVVASRWRCDPAARTALNAHTFVRCSLDGVIVRKWRLDCCRHHTEQPHNVKTRITMGWFRWNASTPEAAKQAEKTLMDRAQCASTTLCPQLVLLTSLRADLCSSLSRHKPAFVLFKCLTIAGYRSFRRLCLTQLST
jgi:hypothetical protein